MTKPADKKPAEAKKPAAARVSAKITLTQTRTLESQYDTTSKKIEDLDKKLVEIEARFIDRPEHIVAAQTTKARADLKVAAEAMVASKDAFAEIGEALRDFFG